ncbi:hypothetical protein OPV22_017442 [Ensete ventricosum]|uniref:ADP/ATP translocase n=1 Tax=Ensete ventricosum TaxID=4639 RepID=A0AAV8QY06_ENSVE|nr:hypothetical protein OPV22_017442 [Ensete ventricosum]
MESTSSSCGGGEGSGGGRRKGRMWEFQRDVVAGAVMGGMVHTVVAPIERAKLLLQTQESNAALLGRGRRFRGMIDCLARTVREEGVLSLWRGNGTSVLRYYPSVALNFSLKDLYRTMLKRGEADQFMSIAASNFMAGAAAGCTTLVIIYPLDIAHTRLAADIGRTDSRQFRGICHFLHTIYKKDGIQESALWKRWVTAQAVTTMAGLASYPLDTVRRRMMMQSGLEEQMYQSTLDCWRKIYRLEGLTSFYRGAVSNMFRSTGAAAILVLYDEIKKFMKWGGF